MTPRWPGVTVTVAADDLHILLAFAQATGFSAVLTADDVAALNRIVDASNAAKGLPVGRQHDRPV